MYVDVAEFGVHLAELTVDAQGVLAIRQVSRKKLPANTFFKGSFSQRAQL